MPAASALPGNPGGCERADEIYSETGKEAPRCMTKLIAVHAGQGTRNWNMKTQGWCVGQNIPPGCT